jgi:hypothetical protein
VRLYIMSGFNVLIGNIIMYLQNAFIYLLHIA